MRADEGFPLHIIMSSFVHHSSQYPPYYLFSKTIIACTMYLYLYSRTERNEKHLACDWNEVIDVVCWYDVSNEQ